MRAIPRICRPLCATTRALFNPPQARPAPASAKLDLRQSGDGLICLDRQLMAAMLTNAMSMLGGSRRHLVRSLLTSMMCVVLFCTRSLASDGADDSFRVVATQNAPAIQLSRASMSLNFHCSTTGSIRTRSSRSLLRAARAAYRGARRGTIGVGYRHAVQLSRSRSAQIGGSVRE